MPNLSASTSVVMAVTWLTVLCFVLATTNIVLGDTTLKVTTLLTEPFARYISLTALPHELEGYIPDLLSEIEKDPDVASANIKFAISPVEDGKYGSIVSGGWDGMIRKLKDGESDLAAAPLTMNDRRKNEVTFLEPAFMTFDLAILMRKTDVSPDVQSFHNLNEAVDRQTKYIPGAVQGGSTATYLAQSQYIYIPGKMSNVENVEEGVKRVRDSTDSHPYIFIGEQQTLEYHASQKPCDLTVVKGNATVQENIRPPPSEYHLAAKKGLSGDIVNKLQAALVKLNETGRLDELYNKWWTEHSQCKGTDGTPSHSTAITSGTAILVPILFAVLWRLSGE